MKKNLQLTATASAPDLLVNARATEASTHIAAASVLPPMLTTSELADGLKLSPRTLHKHYCQKGHFYGLKPVKLSSGRGGRLLWPADSLEQIAARSGV
jgi:hypothetical protein